MGNKMKSYGGKPKPKPVSDSEAIEANIKRLSAGTGKMTKVGRKGRK